MEEVEGGVCMMNARFGTREPVSKSRSSRGREDMVEWDCELLCVAVAKSVDMELSLMCQDFYDQPGDDLFVPA